jgi:hypothetical protein
LPPSGRPRSPARSRASRRSAPAPTPRAILIEAESLARRFGRAAAGRKRALLGRLASAELAHAREVERLHDLLCFWRAYPDDAPLLAKVERMLARFAQRADLRRHAATLEGSGMAGTEIRFRFFAPTARWLAERWPDRLRVDWDAFDAQALEPWLPFLVHPAEVPALDEYELPVRDWLRWLRGPSETDAVFMIRRLFALTMDDGVREMLYDQLDPPLVLQPGTDTPSRTTAKRRGAKVHWQRRELSRDRPAPAEWTRLRPKAVRDVAPAEGQRLIDLARAAMLTRRRDLDAFAHGDPHDVRRVEFGDGLEFACIGVRPQRRLLLEAVYGYLTLKNGVPIGYVLTASLFGSAELAYNVFETWRGAEAGSIYGRVLAMTCWLYGCDAFTIVPYQLGEGNDEALETGAWWFYQKMGFRPRDPGARSLMQRELGRMRRDPSHRSSASVLRRLARANLHLFLDRPRADVLGELELANVGLHASRFLAPRFGADRESALVACAAEAAGRLGTGPAPDWSASERQAWSSWAPLVPLLGVEAWSAPERGALVEVIRAKGGRREADFVRRFDAHARLRAALRRLAKAPPPAPTR